MLRKWLLLWKRWPCFTSSISSSPTMSSPLNSSPTPGWGSDKVEDSNGWNGRCFFKDSSVEKGLKSDFLKNRDSTIWKQRTISRVTVKPYNFGLYRRRKCNPLLPSFQRPWRQKTGHEFSATLTLWSWLNWFLLAYLSSHLLDLSGSQENCPPKDVLTLPPRTCKCYVI